MRSFLGVVLGYLAMFATVFITLTAAYFLLGMERTFQPGSYDVTLLWVVVMLTFSVVAAIIGGKVCRMISRKGSALLILATLVLVLGLTSAVASVLASRTPLERTGDVSNQEAMTKAQLPTWAAVLLPVLCTVGVGIGGKGKRE